MLDNPDTLKKIQVVLIGLLAFGAVGYLMAGVYVYGIDSEQGIELWSDIKLIVIAGILAAFALLGLGRRASTDK
jgi:hypothetical protein